MVGMYQLDQATWYPDIWLNILGVSVKVFLDEINVWLGELMFELLSPVRVGLIQLVGGLNSVKSEARVNSLFCCLFTSWDICLPLLLDWSYTSSSPGSPVADCGTSQPPQSSEPIPYNVCLFIYICPSISLSIISYWFWLWRILIHIGDMIWSLQPYLLSFSHLH